MEGELNSIWDYYYSELIFGYNYIYSVVQCFLFSLGIMQLMKDIGHTIKSVKNMILGIATDHGGMVSTHGSTDGL